MSDYPEHDKLRAIVDQSQAIGDFLDWLTSIKGYRLATYRVFIDPPEGERFTVVKAHSGWRVKDSQEILNFRGYVGEPHPIEAAAIAAAGERERKRLKWAQDNPHLVIDFPNIPDLLAEHFGIDQDALEREKRAMLAAIRSGPSTSEKTP